MQKGDSNSHGSAQPGLELTEAARLSDEFNENSEVIRRIGGVSTPPMRMELLNVAGERSASSGTAKSSLSKNWVADLVQTRH
jgi:hypothetical protein